MTIFARIIMKKYLYFITFLALFILTGCGSGGGHSTQAVDTLYAPRYARHFVVLSRGDSVILRVKNPWQGAVNIHYDYVIGKSPERIITMSSSHSAFIEELEVADAIVGVSGPQYLSSRTLRHLPDVGYDNSLNYEVIVSLAPQMLTTYEISGENSPGTEKLRSLGINVVYIADYLEQTPLAKAEWVVAFGAIMGRVDSAQRIFNRVEHRYNDLKQEVGSHYSHHLEQPSSECALCRLNLKRPVVMLNSPYNDVWYMPGDSSYIVALVRDAGGIYAGRGVSDNISRSVSIEMAYTLLKNSDVWLNPTASINSLADLEATNALLGNITIPVYNNTARGGAAGGSDFWESGVLRCDLALQDMISILHPGLLSNHTLYYYKPIR